MRKRELKQVPARVGSRLTHSFIFVFSANFCKEKACFLPFRAKLDLFSVSVMLFLMRRKATTKNADNHAPRFRLDNAELQAILRKNIASNGRVANCWQDICSERSFLRWKKARKAVFQAIFDDAMIDFRLKVELTNPDIVSECTQQLFERIRARQCTTRELQAALEFFYKLRKEL